MTFQKYKRGETVLEARGITKRFPGVVANDGIDFAIKAGEIHAVLGENGAGKTTLMKILFGQLEPDEGEVYIGGERVQFKSPLDAIELGIGMVHQRRKLVTAHTVLENVLLGHPGSGAIIDSKRASREITAWCDKFGFNIDPRAKIWQLSEGEKQAVEILKALYRGAEVLILDEPTTALTPLETDALLSSIKEMSKENLAIVPFITHKLPIVLRISDKITVLRQGKVVSTIDTADASERILAKKLVGREIMFRVERKKVERGKPILTVNQLSSRSDKGFMALRNASFSICGGEIFGVAGVSGNGQRELVETLAGLRKAAGGQVFIDDTDVTDVSSSQRWRLGMGYIPADRNGIGSIAGFSLVENTALNYYFDPDFSRRGILDYRRLKAITSDLIAEYGVVTPGPNEKVKNLSGGNLQKIILARVLSRNPRVVVADLPTQGLDIGATEFVRNRLVEAKSNGAAVLLISEDLEEILSISDWVAPIYEGELMGIIPGDEASRESIGAMMAGIRKEMGGSIPA